MRPVAQFVAGLLIATSALANDSSASIGAADPPSPASPQPKAEAQPQASPGYRLVTLHSFSCGDFCWLELTEAGQPAPRAFVCLARLCRGWGNSEQEALPAGLRMARAEARFVAVSCQVDDYPVCTKVKNGEREAVIDLRLVK